MLTERRLTRTDETAGILVMILTEEFAADLGSCFVLEISDRPLFVTSNRYIPVKNQLDWSTVVSCACEMIQLFPVAFYTVRGVNKFEFMLLIKKHNLQHTVRGTYVFDKIRNFFSPRQPPRVLRHSTHAVQVICFLLSKDIEIFFVHVWFCAVRCGAGGIIRYEVKPHVNMGNAG
jgi:hypothetical protein